MLQKIEEKDPAAIIFKEELSKQNILLQSVIKNIRDVLVAADKSGKLLIYNPTFKKIIGIGLLDIPEEKWADTYCIFWPDTRKIMKTEDLPIVKALQGENVDSMEMFVQHYQKTEGNFVIISARPLKDFL